MPKLTESLEYMDMADQVTPKLSIDEFQSTIGDDRDIIVLTFIVNGKEVGKDLVDWLERGYEFIIDAQVSPGEVLDKKYYVFAEVSRRSSMAERIVEILDDLYTLTGFKTSDWTISAYDQDISATPGEIERVVPLTPAKYSEIKDTELNEWRSIAGLKTSPVGDDDPEIVSWKRIAGII